ncbi:LLM class F420-dependent oxidoreductase [Nitriliruptor alkaliphilus]|uniref:LLM class F420-dependent oxidoreductase n=1 Tax=Nitriliruptor alkaliphilus TaxID=427918 RepID=UPI00069837CE|nr:LLM class F420-dependent oxidoreductase [Nitriliruptor alkaliphilus]
MEISVVVAARPDVPPQEDLEVGVMADRLGFHELWIGEGWVWDAFVLATAIASRTDRIPLTVGPIPVSVRDPVMIASAAASTAAIARRPVGVALGTSSVRYVEAAHGRSRRRPATALSESAQVVRALFGGRPVDFDGEVISTHGYHLRLDPPGGPITVAAFGDRAIEVAATHADRMVLDLVSPDLAAEFRSRLHAAAARVGRPVPRLAAWIPAAVAPDPASYAQMMWSLVGYLEVAGYAEMFRDAGFVTAVDLASQGADRQELFDALPADAAYRVGLVGDAEAVSDRLAAYASAGLDEAVVVPATAGDPGGERTLTALAALRAG